MGTEEFARLSKKQEDFASNRTTVSLTNSEDLQLKYTERLLINSTLRISFTEKDYLTDVRDIRWTLTANNRYASNLGEEDNFYMFVNAAQKNPSDQNKDVSIKIDGFYPRF